MNNKKVSVCHCNKINIYLSSCTFTSFFIICYLDDLGDGGAKSKLNVKSLKLSWLNLINLCFCIFVKLLTELNIATFN